MKRDEHLSWCRAATFQRITLHKTKLWFRLLFSVNLLVTACTTFQTTTASRTEKTSDTLLLQQGTLSPVVEKGPEFPGGEQEFTRYLKDSISYPPSDKLLGVEGRVYVEFEVHRSGQIFRVKLYPGTEEFATEAMQEQVLRAIRRMPKWTPAYQNGHPVDVKYLKLVRFGLHN